MLKPRVLFILLWIVLLLALARHLWLGCYVHPFADDFSYAVAGMRTALGERLIHEYTSWNGRYFSNILVLRGPLVLGLANGLVLYRASAIALVLFTWFAAYRFVRVLMVPLTKGLSAMVALFFTLLFLHVMPDASEGFYWYTGAVTYQLPNALSLLLAANWLRAMRAPDPGPSNAWYAVQVLLVAVIAGSNEVHMAFLVAGGVALWLHLRAQGSSLSRAALFLLVVAVSCAAVVMLAPGNGTRGAHFPLRHDVLRTLGYSLAQTARFAGRTLISVPMALLSLVFIRIFRDALSAGLVRPFQLPINKWVALAAPFLLLFLAMVVTYWPMGQLGQHRTVNMALFYFLPAWFFALAIWDQVFFRPKGWLKGEDYGWGWRGTLLFVGLCFIIQGRDFDVTGELLDGTMAGYDQGMGERYRVIQANLPSTGVPVVLPSIERPTCLKVLPLDTSPHHWMNRSMADYFGDPNVDLIEPGPPAE